MTGQVMEERGDACIIPGACVVKHTGGGQVVALAGCREGDTDVLSSSERGGRQDSYLVAVDGHMLAYELRFKISRILKKKGKHKL